MLIVEDEIHHERCDERTGQQSQDDVISYLETARITLGMARLTGMMESMASAPDLGDGLPHRSEIDDAGSAGEVL